MNFAEKELLERGVPDALVTNRGTRVKTALEMQKRRAELKNVLQEEIYGVLPPKPDHMSVEKSPGFPNFCAGKVVSNTVILTVHFCQEAFTFPVYEAIPKKEGKIPAFIHINFHSDISDIYQPTEEITDRGFAVFSFRYKDITSDNGDFKNLCAKYLSSSRRAKNSSGKIMMWAWAAMRVMDYVQRLPEIDKDNIAVIGHSHLGKTALVTAAFDERFKYAISNNSGCSGAAISRKKTGETLENITHRFPFWFCPIYKENTNPEDKCFDQNFLLALIPPRHIMIGSAKEDVWSDPKGEFLGCASANSVYALYGKRGLVFPDGYPEAKCVLGDGDSLYQIRNGLHYLSREDWNSYMDFIESKLEYNL